MRTSEELGRLAYEAVVNDPVSAAKYNELGESGKRLWDRVGRRLYDLGVEDGFKEGQEAERMFTH